MAEQIIQTQPGDANGRDEEIGKEIGGVGGAVTGAVAGAMAGPVGAVIGAVIGGVTGAVASKAAVHQVDKVDDDSTISGIGANTHANVSNTAYNAEEKTENALGMNGVPGKQIGGHDIDGTPDERGITEKIADAVTGDRIDDKTGKPVA